MNNEGGIEVNGPCASPNISILAGNMACGGIVVNWKLDMVKRLRVVEAVIAVQGALCRGLASKSKCSRFGKPYNTEECSCVS